jgi:hypothetical protein
MSFKFNVGDKVRILDFTGIDDLYGGWNDTMKDYIGKIVTIKGRDTCGRGNNFYSLYEVVYTWDERALTPVTVSLVKPPKKVTSFTKEDIHNMTTEVAENVFDHYQDRLFDNASNYSFTGIRANVTAWAENKGLLVNVLRKHPHWNEQAKAVIVPASVPRSVEPDKVKAALNKICDLVHEKKHDIICKIALIKPDNFDAVTVESRERLQKQVNTLEEARMKLNLISGELYNYVSSYVTRDDTETVDLSKLPFLGEQLCATILESFPSLKLRPNQKISTAIKKICTLPDVRLDEEPDFNRLYAAFCDTLAITVLNYTYVISVHPADYLLMSNGNSWSSCHTILNKQGTTYSGCYMGGTTSYMTDESTIVTYTLPDDFDATSQLPYQQEKIQRQLFHVTPSMTHLIQARLYPQCNDDTTDGDRFTTTFRNIFEGVISTCLDVPNLWAKKITPYDYSDDYCGYQDLQHYKNWHYAVSNSADGEVIFIGNTSYCLNCGKPKFDGNDDNLQKSLYCQACGVNRAECHDCGCSIDLEDDEYAEESGYYYCTDCSSYCSYHDCRESDSDHRFTYVERYGDVCEEGLNEGDFFYCANCDSWYHRGGAESYVAANGDTICDNCYTQQYFTCSACEGTFQDNHLNIMDGDYYCDECYSQLAEVKQEPAEVRQEG